MYSDDASPACCRRTSATPKRHISSPCLAKPAVLSAGGEESQRDFQRVQARRRAREEGGKRPVVRERMMAVKIADCV